MFRDEIFESLHIVLFLSLEVGPEFSEVLIIAGVGDVLVESPHGVDPLAELVDHVVVVIGDCLRFADVFHLFFCCEWHGMFFLSCWFGRAWPGRLYGMQGEGDV